MGFSTILADPPWPMQTTGRRTPARVDSLGYYRASSGKLTHGNWWGRFTNRTVALPYTTLTIKQIIELPQTEKLATLPLTQWFAADAHLYLWTTNKFIEAAYTVARAWGFKLSTLLTWCKPPMGLGFGGAFCNTTEFILFARRGKLPHQQRIDSTWWRWSRPYENGHIKHSAKPPDFYRVVEMVSPPPYLELFARQRREGWCSWGHEA